MFWFWWSDIFDDKQTERISRLQEKKNNKTRANNRMRTRQTPECYWWYSSIYQMLTHSSVTVTLLVDAAVAAGLSVIAVYARSIIFQSGCILQYYCIPLTHIPLSVTVLVCLLLIWRTVFMPFKSVFWQKYELVACSRARLIYHAYVHTYTLSHNRQTHTHTAESEIKREKERKMNKESEIDTKETHTVYNKDEWNRVHRKPLPVAKRTSQHQICGNREEVTFLKTRRSLQYKSEYCSHRKINTCVYIYTS